MTTKQKRTRTKNFSEQEKELLITLITPYIIILLKILKYVFHQCSLINIT